MSVVTIRGRLGTWAPDIGKLLADKLHAEYVDREIIAEVAARLNRDEQDVLAKDMPPGSLWGRIAEALAQSGPDFQGAYLPPWQIPVDDTRYLLALESVVKQLARGGSMVILGRGSQFILKDHPGALHALAVAPLDLRVKRVMPDLHLDQEAAEKQISHFDSSIREFTRRYFRAELEDAAHYDIVINTAHYSVDSAASIVLEALSLKEETATE